VLVKANAYSLAGDGALAVLGTMYGTAVREGGWWGQLAVAVVLAGLAARESQRVRRFVLGGALLAAVLQLAAGRVNWFHRYEVYALIFTALVATKALIETVRVRRDLLAGMLVAGLLLLGAPYGWALWDTPAAASNVYQQQYQMHRFLADYYRGTVAVNDLGWVSYRRPAGVYVLDLWGLASPAASRQAHKDADWLDTITRAHGAGLAMIYPDWFEEGAPDDWDPLATMCISGPRVSVARPCMVFFDTGVGGSVGEKERLAAQLTAEIAAFARTLPAGVKMTLGRDSTDKDE
jgi:hypothetical protein